MKQVEFLNKNKIDALLIYLNRRLELKELPVVNLYIVGNAAMILRGVYFEPIYSIDAIWNDDVIKEGINEVAKRFKLDNTWCNQKIKTKRGYTDAIYTNSSIYNGTGIPLNSLVVYTVNLDLLLVMKLMQLKEDDTKLLNEINHIVNYLKRSNIQVSKDYIHRLLIKYYGTSDKLTNYAKNFIGL